MRLAVGPVAQIYVRAEYGQRGRLAEAEPPIHPKIAVESLELAEVVRSNRTGPVPFEKLSVPNDYWVRFVLFQSRRWARGPNWQEAYIPNARIMRTNISKEARICGAPGLGWADGMKISVRKAFGKTSSTLVVVVVLLASALAYVSLTTHPGPTKTVTSSSTITTTGTTSVTRTTMDTSTLIATTLNHITTVTQTLVGSFAGGNAPLQFVEASVVDLGANGLSVNATYRNRSNSFQQAQVEATAYPANVTYEMGVPQFGPLCCSIVKSIPHQWILISIGSRWNDARP